MESFWQDVKYGTRMLRKSPGFTLVVVLTLALGISANTAIFSVVDALLLRPLPFQDPERLVVVWGTRPEVGREEASLPDFADWRAQNKTFDALAAGAPNSVTLTGQDEPERLTGAAMTANFLSVLGVQPILGRSFLPEEDRPGGPRAVILSHGLWQRRFGEDRGVLGRTMTLDGQGYTMEQVLGIALRQPRFAMTLLALFAAVALALAGVGIYGVMSYLVEQRTHEFGIRMALGAQGGNILALVIREAFTMAVIGLAAGLAAALILTRFLGSLIFGISPNDLLTFSLVALLMVGVALVACFVPARRATRVDPVVALRYE
jgi:putative ABC transport system permease protein